MARTFKTKKLNSTADLKFLRVNIGTRCISRFFGNCNNKIKTSMKITLHSMCVFHRFLLGVQNGQIIPKKVNIELVNVRGQARSSFWVNMNRLEQLMR